MKVSVFWEITTGFEAALGEGGRVFFSRGNACLSVVGKGPAVMTLGFDEFFRFFT